MRILYLSFLISFLLISCSEDEPGVEAISRDPISGNINRESWSIATAGGRYGFSDGGNGNTVETISLYFFKVPDHNYCYGFLDTSLGPFINLTILPKEGRREIGVGTLTTGVFLQNVDYQYTIYAEVVIDELDTTGIGYVRGRVKYRNSAQGSPSDRFEGAFETSLCRDIRKPEYLDQNVGGIVDGLSWELMSGGAIGSTDPNPEKGIFLFGQQVVVQDPAFNKEVYPRLVITFQGDNISEGEYLIKNSSGATLAFVNEDYSGVIAQTDLVGRVEILSIGTSINGRLDLFARRGNGYELNGNFSIPYYP